LVGVFITEVLQKITDDRLDSTFRTGGILTVSTNVYDKEGKAVELPGDGKIIAAGYNHICKNGKEKIF